MRYIKLFEQNTPKIGIFNAIRYLKISEIKTYLDIGGEVNIRNNSGRTPLISTVCVANASQSKIIKIIELLDKYGADLNLQDKNGKTALIESAEYPRYNVMIKLIELGAEWYIKDDEGLDFIDYVKMNEDEESTEVPKIVEKLEKKYPDKYKNYLTKKDADKFNM